MVIEREVEFKNTHFSHTPNDPIGLGESRWINSREIGFRMRFVSGCSREFFCEMRIRLEEKPLMRGEVLFALILQSHLFFTSHHHHHFLYPLHTPKKRAKAKRVNRVNLLHTSRARGALSTTENRFYFCFRRISISDSFTPSNAINNVAGVGRAENLTHNTSSFGGVTMRWKSQSIFVSCSV